MGRIIDVNTYFGTYPKRKVEGSITSVVSFLTTHHVDLALTISMKGVFYDYSRGNDETMNVCKREKVLEPVATIDPRKYWGDGDEVKRLKELGFKIIRLFPEYQGWPIEYEPLKGILRELDAEGMPLMIAAHTYGIATKVVELASNFSFPIIFTSIGYWTLSEAIALMKRNDEVYIETHLLDSPDGIKVVCDEVGAERLMFGSNFPLTYFMGPFLAVKNSDISEAEKELIFGNNANRVVMS